MQNYHDQSAWTKGRSQAGRCRTGVSPQYLCSALTASFVFHLGLRALFALSLVWASVTVFSLSSVLLFWDIFIEQLKDIFYILSVHMSAMCHRAECWPALRGVITTAHSSAICSLFFPAVTFLDNQNRTCKVLHSLIYGFVWAHVIFGSKRGATFSFPALSLCKWWAELPGTHVAATPIIIVLLVLLSLGSFLVVDVIFVRCCGCCSGGSLAVVAAVGAVLFSFFLSQGPFWGWLLSLFCCCGELLYV